jgi:diphthine-ammonia ligase
VKLGVLFSGGKDCSLALHKAWQFHDVVCLVTVISESPESYMFHYPNVELTRMQSEATGLPLVEGKTKGEKETELEDLKRILIQAKMKFKIEGVVTGAIRSTYQASRTQRISNELGLWSFNPLWLKDQIELLNEVLQNDFKVIISGVFAFPLNTSFLGKTIDERIIERLKHLMERYDLNPTGEGGEIETTVTDAPFFKKKIEVIDYEVTCNDNSGIFKIRKAKLVDK